MEVLESASSLYKITQILNSPIKDSTVTPMYLKINKYYYSTSHYNCVVMTAELYVCCVSIKKKTGKKKERLLQL